MLSTAESTLYAMDAPDEEVLPNNAAPEPRRVLSLSESRQNLEALKKFTSSLKMICSLPQKTLGFDPQNPTPQNIADLKKRLAPFTRLSIPDTLFNWMIEEEFRTRISHPTDLFSDHLMGVIKNFDTTLKVQDNVEELFKKFKELTKEILKSHIPNKNLMLLRKSIQIESGQHQKKQDAALRLYEMNYYLGSTLIISLNKKSDYQQEHNDYILQEDLTSFLHSLFISPEDFKKIYNYENAFEALEMLCFAKMKANRDQTTSKNPRLKVEKVNPPQKKKKEAQQNSEQPRKAKAKQSDISLASSSNDATASTESTSAGIYSSSAPAPAPAPAPEDNQKPSPELYEEKTSDDEILEEKAYEDYIRELIEYQLSQKNPMKGARPQAVREENIRPLYDLSNTSASILTGLLDPQKYAAVMKRINMLAPLAQLFEELNIGYRLTEGKIISPRNGDEAFVFHAIHGRPMGKTVQSVVGGLIEHLDKMIPAWRNFLLSEN